MQLSVLSVVLIVFFCFQPIFSRKRRDRNKDEPPCVGNLCSEIDAYPSDKIDQLLNENKIIYSKTTNLVIKPVKQPKVVIKTRIYESKEENLCKTRKISILPKYDTETKYHIVNTKSFTQLVTFELCSKKNGKCQYDTILNLSISCKQLYNKVKLLYYHDGQLNYGLFTMPNACVCVYKKNFDKELA